MSPQDVAALQVALDEYDRGDTIKAEPALRTLVAKFPKNYPVNEALGSLYAEGGDAARALPYLKLACDLAPREALAHANLGATYLKLSNGAEALRELERAAELDPKNGATQANLGQALMLAGQSRAAVQAFSVASKLTPSDPAVKYQLAFSLFESGSVKEAADLLDTLPAATMTDEMHGLAADADERSGRFAKALIHFQAAAQLNPSEANLYVLTAELLRHWNWDEAIKVANFSVARYPSSTRFKMAAGIAYYGKSDYKSAAEVFAGLLNADANNPLIADLLGRSCGAMAEGETADCSAIYDFVQNHPGNATMMTYAANAILREPDDKRDLDKADALLKAAMAADPKLPEAYLSLGVLDQVRLQWKESAVALEHAVALRPTLAEAHYRLSRAYAHLGRRDEAQAEIALHQRYSKQAKDSLDARMQEVMRFILNPS